MKRFLVFRLLPKKTLTGKKFTHWSWSSLPPPRPRFTSRAAASNTQPQAERTALTGERFTDEDCALLCGYGTSDGHTCSTSLTARRQKRARILGLKTWFQILARNGLCWSQLLCCSFSLSSAAPLPSTCPCSPLPTCFNSLSFFKLLLPYSSCPYPPITTPQTSLLLPSLSPYISSLSFFPALMALSLL